MAYVVEADEKLRGFNFVWHISGSDWHEISRTRVWLFPKRSAAIQLDIMKEDCDGDFYNWTVSDKLAGVRRSGSVSSFGSYEDTDAEIIRQIDEAIQKFAEGNTEGVEQIGYTA